MNRLTCSNTLRAAFASTTPSIATKFGNADFVVPNNATWISVDVRFTTNRIVEMGKSKRIRMTGVMLVEIRVPILSGEKNALTTADTIIGAFQYKVFSGVFLQQAEITHSGPDDTWWRVNVDCHFYADEIT